LPENQYSLERCELVFNLFNECENIVFLLNIKLLEKSVPLKIQISAREVRSDCRYKAVKDLGFLVIL
jgi:hypothetical protein